MRLRAELAEALAPYGLSRRFAHIAQQRGMCSFTGLTPAQVQALRKQFSVYMAGSMVGRGRANMAGLDAERLGELAPTLFTGSAPLRGREHYRCNTPLPAPLMCAPAAPKKIQRPFIYKINHLKTTG